MSLTVIVPTFDRLAQLQSAVASLDRQRADLPLTLDILVVDDGSRDGTANWLAAQSNLRAVSRANGGVTAARNTGLDHLLPDTRYVTFLDSDDASPKGALMAQLGPLLADPALDLTYGRMLMIDSLDPVLLEPPQDARRLELTGIHLSCALYRRDLIDRIGRFDPELLQAEDTDYLLRTFEAGTRFLQHDTICLYYHRHPGNMTKRLQESRRFFALALQKSIQRRRKDPSIKLVKPSFEVQGVGGLDFY
jgi:glycosyltransferase involved in cell wall biosynthesis